MSFNVGDCGTCGVRGIIRRGGVDYCPAGHLRNAGLVEVRVLLGMPAPELFPNKRPHRLGKNRLFQAYKGEAKIEALRAMALRIGRLKDPEASVTFHFPRPRPWPDPDNCATALKAVWDGFQAAGMYRNDAELRVHPIERVRAEPRRRAGELVEIVIRGRIS